MRNCIWLLVAVYLYSKYKEHKKEDNKTLTNKKKPREILKSLFPTQSIQTSISNKWKELEEKKNIKRKLL